MNRNTQQNNQPFRRSRKAGYSLVEVLMVLGISSFVIAGILAFYVQFYKIGFVNEQRNRINRDIRQLTGELADAGRQANYFTIYNSYLEEDRDKASDRILDGGSGDMLVFVYLEEDGDGIESISGYFRDVSGEDADVRGPVRRFTQEFSPASDARLESLLPTPFEMSGSDEVVELSRGLSNGKLFYNFWGRSIMVNGQIYHGNDAKRVTETYNFTISPRG